MDSGGKSFYFATAVLTCPFSPFASSLFLKRFQSEELEKGRNFTTSVLSFQPRKDDEDGGGEEEVKLDEKLDVE